MINTTFAYNLRMLRRALNLTQRELADKVGISWEMISRYENGKSMPDWETFLRLAKILRVAPSRLLDPKLKLGDNTPDYRTTATLPLVIASPTLRSCNDLKEAVAKTNAFYEFNSRHSALSTNSFVMVVDNTSFTLPNLLKPLADQSMYVVFELLPEGSSLENNKLYLVLNSTLSIVIGRNVVTSGKICAKVERIIVDFV